MRIEENLFSIYRENTRFSIFNDLTTLKVSKGVQGPEGKTLWIERISEVLSAMHSQVNLAAICIQKFVSSRVSASHDTCRTLLRPSSITKPRYPSLSVVSNGWRVASPALCGTQPPTSLILEGVFEAPETQDQ